MISKLIRRIRYFLFRGRAERELQEEMAAHREMMGDRAASFGPRLRLREEARDAWGFVWLEHAVQDVRHGTRALRRTPGFTYSAIAILAVGIGLNLTLLELVNALLLQPLAVRNPETLARFTEHAEDKGGTMTTSTFPVRGAREIVERSPVFQAGLFETVQEMAWGDGAGDPARAAFVSGNWFSEMGYAAQTGRVFEATEDRKDASPVAVLSYRFWDGRLGRDPDLVGGEARVNGRVVTVIGVAPASFPMDADLWIPYEQIAYFGLPPTNVNFYARVAPGTTAAAIRESTAVVVKDALLRPGEPWTSIWLEANFATERFMPANERRRGLQLAWTISGLTLLVLLIACANLSNLVFSRALGRLRELSVRAALGASRMRIARQLLAECLLLACAGAFVGIGVSYAAAHAITAAAPIALGFDFRMDGSMLFGVFSLVLVSMLAVGLIPVARVCRRDLAGFMKDGNQQVSAGLQRTRIRQVLVAGQLAGSCLLLIVAGLMLERLWTTMHLGPGYEVRNLAIVNPLLYRMGASAPEPSSYWERVKNAAAAIPGVERVVLTDAPPLKAGNTSGWSELPGLRVIQARVEPNFFDVMGIPLLSGRTFDPSDAQNAIVVSRKIALALFGTVDVAGKHFINQPIVGVASDAKLGNLQNPAIAEMYSAMQPAGMQYAVLLVRTKVDSAGLLPALRQTAATPGSGIFADVHRVETDLDQVIAPVQFASMLGVFVALLALILACLGVFGVVAYSVRLRTKEIGIRIALGSPRADILMLLTRQALWPGGFGIVLGSAGAWYVTKLLVGAPFYLQATPPGIFAAAVAVLLVAAFIVALTPALGALRRDPLEALRYE